jgi:hypothetical protein
LYEVLGEGVRNFGPRDSFYFFPDTFIISGLNLSSVSYGRSGLESESELELGSDPLLFAVLAFLSYELNQAS